MTIFLHMEWFVAGVIFAVLNAITMLINQHYKLNGHLISGIRGICVGFIYIPMMFVVEFPRGTYFWSLIIAEGLLSAFFNARLYSSSAIYGAAATSTISVLAIAFGAFFWWIFDYREFFSLLHSPEMFAGTICALSLIVMGFKGLSRSQEKTSRKGAIGYMMPAVIVFAIMLIVRKEAMTAVNFYSATVYYGGVSILISGMFNMLFYAKKHGVDFLEKKTNRIKVLKAGILMSIASASTIFFGNLSSEYVPNPAYVSALTLMSPLVIFAMDYYMGRPRKLPVASALMMIIGLASLLYFNHN